LFAIAIMCGVLAPILDLTGTLSPLKPFAGTAWRVAGVAGYCGGLAGTLWAQVGMGDSWRIGVDESERTRLIIRGPFLHVRNPIFTCMIVAVSGLALLLPNALALAAVAALITG